MPLTRNAFSVIFSLIDKKCSSQRQISEAAGLSLGLVNDNVQKLARAGVCERLHSYRSGQRSAYPI